MFIFDEEFWESIGMSWFSEAQKQKFASIVKGELESRVGEEIRKGLSGEQIKEFEEIIDNDAQANLAWLRKEHPHYGEGIEFKKLKEEKGLVGNDLINEVASVLWIASNVPNCRFIVWYCTRQLRREIILNKDSLIPANPAITPTKLRAVDTE
jgi:hypothetical protein